jgi:hypothetical protein
MGNLNKDIFMGLMFMIGIWSFISGQFIVSTVLFGIAAIYGNISASSSHSTTRSKFLS